MRSSNKPPTTLRSERFFHFFYLCCRYFIPVWRFCPGAFGAPGASLLQKPAHCQPAARARDVLARAAGWQCAGKNLLLEVARIVDDANLLKGGLGQLLDRGRNLLLPAQLAHLGFNLLEGARQRQALDLAL